MNQNDVDEMIDQVTELTKCYALWWYFFEKPNDVRYAKVERNYPDFFVTIFNSLRQSFCVIMYQLFDKRSDSKSLVRLVDELKGVNPPLAQRLQKEIDVALPTVEKVSFLRCKVFAHRDKRRSPQDVFSAVKLTPKEIGALIQSAQDIVSAVAEAAGIKKKSDLERQFGRCRDAVRSDAYNLMRVLGEDDVRSEAPALESLV